MQLCLRDGDAVCICRIDHVDDRVDPAAIALPHGAEAWLAAQVPQLDRHLTLLNLPHVETNRGDHVLSKVTTRNHADEGRLARVLEADETELHLLLEEERLEPLQHTIHPRLEQALRVHQVHHTEGAADARYLGTYPG